MKKIIALVLSVILLLSMTACRSETNGTDTSENITTETTTETEEPSAETTIANQSNEFDLGEFHFTLLDGMELSQADEQSIIVTLVPDKAWATMYAGDASAMNSSTLDVFVPIQQETWADPDLEHSNESEVTVSISDFDVTFSSYSTEAENEMINYHLVGTFTDTWYIYTFHFVSTEDNADLSRKFGNVLGMAQYSGKESRFEIGSTADTTEPSATPPSASLGTVDNPYGPGMYKVGTDLPEGEYLFIATGSLAAYVCLSSDSNQDDIIENENFTYSFFLTVSDGQYLDATRCSFLIADKYTVNINEDGTFSDGMYRVGIDIPSGEYALASSEHGYYCIYNNSVAPFDIVDNDNFENNSYVTVSDGQYLLITRCTASPVK